MGLLSCRHAALTLAKMEDRLLSSVGKPSLLDGKILTWRFNDPARGHSFSTGYFPYTKKLDEDQVSLALEGVR